MEFLSHIEEVTERVRRGELPPPAELAELKAENRRRAQEAEAEDRPFCDSMPTWINTTNSTVCNLRCPFCDQAYGKGVDVKMTDEVYRRVVEELYPAVETVQLSAYGEPMMTPHIQDKFADMERFGVKLEMMTNATLMRDDELLERMARIMGLLRVSIDGATAETYEGLRVGANFDEVIGNLRRYNVFRHRLPPEERAPLHFSTILMRRTLAELPDFIRLVKELDADTVYVDHMVLFEEAMRDEMLGTDPEWRRRTNDMLARAEETAAQIGQKVVLPPPFALDGEEGGAAAPKPDPVRCWFLWQRMYVGPFGDVIPCCLAGIHANGNVRESTFAAEWNNQLYMDMRRRVHSDEPYPPCATCYLVNRNPDVGQFDFTEGAQEADQLGIADG